ncbi:flagellar hook-length control protein FliK [Colwellia sp. BRX10-3]|uniref:flagellar hook-length control protein FliK n=1 Tax=Colwellia sp. BRX10-3 TaxID=2759844 RepID=UPI0015F43839|nr:flagellar hook-length control protein FliK [Colwellia sp. BRX10-3]MBA6389448.1 flagellar hook-length control protein FliK [Colwellia sp. BRX10-3]
MSQVNLLSVDVGQNPDMQGSKGEAPIKSQAKANAFSDAMEQHYPRKSLAESDNTKQGGNFASKAAEHQQQVIKNDGSLTPVKATKADDAHTLPVPLPIDDESLTSKLTASDSAHTLPVPFPIDNQSLAAQLKAESTDKYDAHTLPVPLPIDDESLITKPMLGNDYILPVTISPNTEQLITAAKSKDDAHITPVPVTPLQSENREFKQVEGALKGDSVAPISYKKPYLDFQSQKLQQQESQSKIDSTDNIANDDTVDLLKMLNGAQQLLTKTAAEQPNIEQKGKNSAVVTEQILASNKIMAESERGKNQVAEQSLLVKNAKGEHVKTSPSASDAQQTQLLVGSKNTAKQLTENATTNVVSKISDNVTGKAVDNVIENVVDDVVDNVAKTTPANIANSLSALDAKPITSKETGIMGFANERGLVDDVDLIVKQVSSQNLAREAAVSLDKNQEAKQVSGNRELHNSVSNGDSELDFANANKTLSSELNVVHKSDVAQSNDVKVQAAESIKAKVAEFVQVNGNEPTQARVINQSTATAISMSTSDVKDNANQKTAANEDVSKLANVMGEEQKSTKNEGEKQLPQAEKVLSAFNQTLDTQAAKPTASSAEIAAQQEQRFESTINQLTTNTVQTQKSITAMNTETIAIYRKDFANAVKDKVMVMINQKIQQVEIKLDPPEMGNIHVRVNLQNEQAAVQFVVQNQQAKEALEQNMGKLRDMLAESGVDVGEASIEQRQAKEQNGNGFDQQTNNGQNSESTEDNFNENDNSMVNVVKASSTGIDYYA